MAEEVRFFLRGLVYLVPITVVYWLVSKEPAGTALLVALVVGFVAVIGLVLLHASSAAAELRPRSGGIAGRLLGAVNRAIGFHERVDAPPPLEGGPDLIPTGSPWPLITAASIVVAGLGLIFGTWLLLPGLALLAWALLGWLTQLDRA
ncbi:MAG: cytochrome c oxidase subunit 4 [Chloroflexi bacterium]|nr:cytochrome c oxidase subunit 4 [Chloroflexota bacterium]